MADAPKVQRSDFEQICPEVHGSVFSLCDPRPTVHITNNYKTATPNRKSTRQVMYNQEEHNNDFPSCTVCRNSARIADLKKEVRDLEYFRRFSAKKNYKQGKSIKDLQSTVQSLEDSLKKLNSANADIADREHDRRISGPAMTPVTPRQAAQSIVKSNNATRSNDDTVQYDIAENGVNGEVTTTCVTGTE